MVSDVVKLSDTFVVLLHTNRCGTGTHTKVGQTNSIVEMGVATNSTRTKVILPSGLLHAVASCALLAAKKRGNTHAPAVAVADSVLVVVVVVVVVFSPSSS